METKRNISLVGIMLIIFISLWTCNNTKLVLYGGYSLLMIITVIKLFFSKRGAVIEIYPQARQVFLFACFCILSIFWSQNKGLAFGINMFIFPCVIMVIVLTNYFVRIKNIDAVLYTICITGIVLTLYIILFEGGLSAVYDKAISSIGDENLYKSRIGGDIRDHNFLGAQCAFSSVVLLYYALFEKKKICYILAAIPGLMCILTGSRTSFVIWALGICLVLYYYQKKDKTIKKYLLLLLGIIVGSFVIIYIFSTDLMYTITHRFINAYDTIIKGSSSDGSTKIRIEMIKIGLEQLENTPALGLGLGGSQLLYAVKIRLQSYAHSDYIELLVNGGIIGFLLYIRIFYHLIKYLRILMKNDNDTKLIISYVLLMMLLASNVFAVTYYNVLSTYILFILWISIIEIKRNEGLLDASRINESGFIEGNYYDQRF